MQKEIIIDITEQGAEGMHFDEFPLSYLGPMSIARASEILFNSETQLWDIHYLHEDGSGKTVHIAKGYQSYELARGVEVEFVQKCRKEGIKFTESFSTARRGVLP